MKKLRSLYVWIIVILFLTSSQKSFAQKKYASNQLIIKFSKHRETKISENLSACRFIRPIKGIDAQLWSFPDSININGQSIKGLERIANYLQNSFPQIEYAHPNYFVELFEVPNDSRYEEMWGLYKINAEETWDIQTGSKNIKVAVIDSGIDWQHEDLVDNIWQNLLEDADGDGTVLVKINGKWCFDPDDINGIDDDGNGYVDDFIGWDFFNDDNDPMDNYRHGTHVAGTIGAVGNNGIGVTGINWNTQLMAIKIFDIIGDQDNCGAAHLDKVIEAINYAIDMNARVSNNSWGTSQKLNALNDILIKANIKDHIFVAAAGNSENGLDNDVSPIYPASFDLENIISVAASDSNDILADFSHFGSQSVDLCAPGVNILSTDLGNEYKIKEGTSMAGPHVAGAAALILSQCEEFNPIEVKDLLLENVDINVNLI